MPELRSGVRKGRAPPVDQKPDKAHRSPASNRARRGKNKNDKNIKENNDCVRTRAAVEREAVLAKQEANSNSNKNNSNDIVIAQLTRNTRTARRITKPLAVRLNPSQPVVPANRPQPEVKTEAGLEAQRVIGKDKMDDESASKSVDKVPGAEDEASTAPLPEKVSGGREGRPIGAYELAKAVEELGAGEILLNCIDCDGQGQGFDIDLVKLISEAVNIPVIASSGAGAVEHFSQVFQQTSASAALAAGIFHRKEVPIQAVKEHLRNQGTEVRL